MAYLTISLSAENLEKLSEQLTRAREVGAEILEFRSDYIKNLDVDKFCKAIELIKQANLPFIVTCRDEAEGGMNGYDEELRLNILGKAIETGADYIDCEYINYRQKHISEQIDTLLSRHSKTRLIISSHNFKGSFDDPQMIYESIVSVNEDAIPKIVYTAHHINDCFDCFDLLRQKQRDAIIICMGKAGEITRILAGKYGSFLTFASLEDAAQTAPGQVSASLMKELYRFDSINAETEIYGIIANPVGHSMSPAIHNACFEKAKMNKVYVPFLIEGDYVQLEEFFELVAERPWLDFRGFSVSIPHKENVLEYCQAKGHFIEPLAIEIGAINTVTVGLNSRLNVYNTDYKGAMDALLHSASLSINDLAGKTAAVIGAGGVARAIVAGLTKYHVDVTIYNRTVSRAQHLAKEFSSHSAGIDQFAEQGANSDIVINCTSVGMYPNVGDCPVPENSLNSNMIVFDTIYNPIETKLLRQAAEVNASIASGVDMFVFQAMEQFKHFTGHDADEELMRKTVFDRL